MQSEFGNIKGQTRELDSEEFFTLYKALDKKILIDVRTNKEFLKHHIHGAKNLDITQEFFGTVSNNLDPDTRVFMYCETGARATAGAKLLASLGLTVFVLNKGIKGINSSIIEHGLISMN
ncbi:rhodanese-like domain-containing protein [Luteibaculum oceani]|nr:rhodanese-like domain-containing protein [Luteibaculum oceani]